MRRLEMPAWQALLSGGDSLLQKSSAGELGRQLMNWRLLLVQLLPHGSPQTNCVGAAAGALDRATASRQSFGVW